MILDSQHGRIATFCVLVVCTATRAGAQTATVSDPSRTEQLLVDQGVPLRVIVTDKLRFKKNQPVHARVVEPVYALDREVLPSGTEVLGRISGFKSVPRWMRITALLSGNLTPLREPQLTFDTLVLRDGKSIPIQTVVSVGSDTVVRFSAGATEQKKGRIASATEAARQQIETRKRAVIDAIKAPGKMERVKEAAWSFAPWHPQYLQAGSRFNAKLLTPIQFGEASIPLSELAGLGSEPPADAIVAARLISSLDSRTSNHGMSVDAVLTRPLLSPENHLIFPEGSRLSGNVTQAQPARHWHRNGKLAFMFTRMQPPSSLDDSRAPVVQEIEGRLDGVEVNGKDGAVQIDEEGGAAAASSKKRFLAPAIMMVLAMNGAEGPEPARIHHIPTGAYRNRYGTRLISGGIGFGLLGSALGRFVGPIGPILGFYGAVRAVYSNVVARGQEVTFPADTPIEIRFGARGETQK
jgi:hypothetical protein